MSVTIKLLVLEDDKKTLAQWQMEVEKRNALTKEIRFHLSQASSIDETKVRLEEIDFDIAVIDINLKSDQKYAQNKDGNEVMKLVLDSEMAAVAVFSGEPDGAAEPPEWAKNVKIFQKGYLGMGPVMQWIDAQIPMLMQIKQVDCTMRREMVALFTRSIWPRWNRWVGGKSTAYSSEFIRESLTRHLTAHLYGVFLEKSFQKVHPEEWYFIPAIRSGLRTGDLVMNATGDVEILITPRCDLARSGKEIKNESIQLAQCIDVSKEWDILEKAIFDAEKALVDNPVDNKKDVEMLKSAVGRAKGNFRMFSQHKNNSSVFHFLPRLSLHNNDPIGPFLIHFDKIRSVPRSDTKGVGELEAARFACIAPEFLPSIVERLGAFFSRFGTPDYSLPD